MEKIELIKYRQRLKFDKAVLQEAAKGGDPEIKTLLGCVVTGIDVATRLINKLSADET